MFPVDIKFVKTHPNAVLPMYNHADPYTGDSGLDVVAVEDVVIPSRYINARAGGYSGHVGNWGDPWATVPIGLKLAYITPGYWFRVEGRSGLGFKKHVFPHFGIIDNPYRGDMGIKIYNFSNDHVFIKAGDKIAQLIVYPLIQANVAFAEEVSESKRGEKGFGSSDKLLPSEIMVDGKPARLE